MSRYTNKVCLITGGTSGIGLEIAKGIAKEGGKVVVCSVDKNIPQAVEEIRQGGKYTADGLYCDVSKQAERLKVLEFTQKTYGRLDVLILNAGIAGHHGRQFDMEDRMYDAIFDINVKSVFFFAKEALPLMRKSGEGGNILITSSLSAVSPTFLVGVYAMSKASIINMCEWLAHELMDDNIRVNCIAPGFVKTQMVADSGLLAFEEYMPKGSIATVDQIAPVALMICSSDGSFVNGEAYVLTGGHRMPKADISKMRIKDPNAKL